MRSAPTAAATAPNATEMIVARIAESAWIAPFPTAAIVKPVCFAATARKSVRTVGRSAAIAQRFAPSAAATARRATVMPIVLIAVCVRTVP